VTATGKNDTRQPAETRVGPEIRDVLAARLRNRHAATRFARPAAGLEEEPLLVLRVGGVPGAVRAMDRGSDLRL
jgi:hypothetical protein